MRDFDTPGRSAAMAANGMAATSHPQASLAAVDVLRAGGNAVDAALAAVAMLCVVEPAMTGIGGDCFVLYAPKDGKPVALNGSGKAPAAATLAWYAEHGFREIPVDSPHAVTVPGAVDAWCVLHAKYGKRPLPELLEPAALAAEKGYVVTPRVARDWADKGSRLKASAAAAAALLKAGKPPQAGEIMRVPALAGTLRRIGREGRAGFYEGPVLRDMLTSLSAAGGLHTAEDFAAQHALWVEPISTPYRGYEVFECPPNGQGLIALMILRILEGYALGDESFSEADRLHLIAEATKASYARRDAFLGDPDHIACDMPYYLSDRLAAETRDRIALDRTLPSRSWTDIEHKDTTYLCVVDGEGNAISFINSLFGGFGSGILAPDSGVLFHHRGSSFRTSPGHPNSIAPGKRPMHTIIPGMLMKDGKAIMPFGIMGGHYQAAAHAHFLHRVLDRGMDPQQAAEAPRIFAYSEVLQVERALAPEIVADLAARGHVIAEQEMPIGGCQAIWIDRARGVLIGGSEPRKDGLALGY